jgi:hypothetical protein
MRAMHNLESLSQPRFVEEDAQLLASELHETFGKNKVLLPGFELPALTALAYYPELTDIRIEFQFVKSNTPMACRPKYSTLWLPAKQRTYVIFITNRIEKGRDEIRPKNLPFNIVTGLIAHELSHVCDYLSKTSFEVLATGLKYSFKSYKKTIERKADLLTVAHGLGNQIAEFGELIRNLQKKYPKDSYYKHYFEFYLTPEEISRILELRGKTIQNPFDEKLGRGRNGRKKSA